MTSFVCKNQLPGSGSIVGGVVYKNLNLNCLAKFGKYLNFSNSQNRRLRRRFPHPSGVGGFNVKCLKMMPNDMT